MRMARVYILELIHTINKNIDKANSHVINYIGRKIKKLNHSYHSRKNFY